MPKVFILALDGLEYDLVKAWKLTNLLQVQYGKIKISSEYLCGEGVPYTPIVWTSFITGKKPDEHKIEDWWTYGRFLDWLRKKPPLIWIKGKRRFLLKFGLKPKVVTKKQWKNNTETVFDAVKPSIPLFIPAYNEPTEPHIRLSEAIGKSIKEYEKTIWQIHQWRVNETFKHLNETWKLFMVWFELADLLGHVYFVRNRRKLTFAYEQLDKLASQIKKHLPKNCIFLIVSDHGMRDSGDGMTGNHSDHAFWSLNSETDWEPKDITDFYPKILEWVNNGEGG
jgi:predicted AlkP superfamily pyrophosphatase or phosphodiesterase